MKSILVIEDNTAIRENIAEVLELAGYEVDTAENGKVGVEKAEANTPDLILCDIMMPVLDGYGVLSIVHKKPALADIPFIFLTAKSGKDDFRYGMNLGADDFIPKPFETNELLSIIELRLSKSEKIKKILDFHEKEIVHTDFQHFTNETKVVEALKALTIDREVRYFSKKSEVYTEGGTPRYLYLIQKGKVKVYKTNENGKELILNLLSEKDFLGYLAILLEHNYIDSAMAIEDCELVMIPKEDFLNLLHSNREVSAKFIKLLAGNVASHEENLLQMAYNSVRKRVSNVLLLLHERYGGSPISMLRDDFAALTGTAKETIIRTLTDFRAEKLISVEEGRIVVLEFEKLKNMMN